MTNFFQVLIISVALSMDTFSLCLGLGTYNPTSKSKLKLSIIVGSMHFLMPLIGIFLGSKMISFFTLNSNVFLGCILLFISFNILIDITRQKEIEPFAFSFFNMLIFAFGVSIDAFSTGLGLTGITQNKLIAMLIFSVVSFLFTYLGLQLGTFAYKKLEKKASILGFLLLFVIGILHICK